MYHIVENINRIKQWQIQLIRLLEGEKWQMAIKDSVNLREKTLGNKLYNSKIQKIQTYKEIQVLRVWINKVLLDTILVFY